MNERVQYKIEQYKRMARAASKHTVLTRSTDHTDSLGELIQTQKDADAFMAELESAVKRKKKFT